MELPHWQLKSIYPSLDSKEFKEDLAKLEAMQINLLSSLKATETYSIDYFEKTLNSVNNVFSLLANISAYVHSHIAVDAFDELASAISSSLSKVISRSTVIGKLFSKYLSEIDLENMIENSELAKAHAFGLRKGKLYSKHLLSPEAEEIASKLSTVAGDSWARLYNELIGKRSIEALIDSEKNNYNLAQLKQLQTDASDSRRKAAFDAEIKLLDNNKYSFAACLNGIKGHVNTLSEERKWDSALDEALFSNNLSQKALRAMQQACVESFEDFGLYFKAKAKLLGKEKLAWYDLFAPIAKDSKTYGWQEAQDFVIENFSSFSSELAAYAQQAFENNHLDVPSRQGKRNGAFCIGFPENKESRIMLNYAGDLDDLFTLAHELGHGYHNYQKYKSGLTATQQKTPMALAETASIFSETIVINAILENADSKQKLIILEQDLVGAAQLIVDIHSRFLFEDAVFEKRKERELSVSELKEIMLMAQDATYGDSISIKHPYMWAHKGHYYSSNRSYYNFPYTFGYLFALGLYAQYQAKPEGFVDNYNKLLAGTGLADAVTLAKDFGIDIEDIDFWRQSLETPKKRISEYLNLCQN